MKKAIKGLMVRNPLLVKFTHICSCFSEEITSKLTSSTAQSVTSSIYKITEPLRALSLVDRRV